MEIPKSKLKKHTSDYLLSAKEKMKSISNSLELRIMPIVDENKYLAISINGKQRILSMEISNILLETKDKKEVLDYLLKTINKAIRQSTLNNLKELLKIISIGEYKQIITDEKPENLQSIQKVENDVNRYSQKLPSIQKSASSNSGMVKIVMTGANIIQSLDIPEKELTSKNKEIIITEIVDTVNELISQFQQDMSNQILKSDKEFTEMITETSGVESL
jgi:DNA-binding protein YbaB